MAALLHPPHLIYCHGFGSGPETTSKGRALRQSLGDEVASVHIPDLQGPRFFDLTIDGMRQRLLDCIADLPADGAPLILAGSSLGAWLCAHLAAELAAGSNMHRLAGLLLIAPAFGFVSRWAEILGEDGVAQWRTTGERVFYHYRSESEQALGVGFLDSCEGLADMPQATALPTLIMHGRHDEVAPWQNSLRYSEGCAEASYHLLDEGHSIDSAEATTCMIERCRSLIRRVRQGKAEAAA